MYRSLLLSSLADSGSCDVIASVEPSSDVTFDGSASDSGVEAVGEMEDEGTDDVEEP